MLRVAVLVSGGGTNLQAIIDQIEQGNITNAKLALVISNKKEAYALTRSEKHHIKGVCISPKDYQYREEFSQVMLDTLKENEIDLLVLAGYLVILPDVIVKAYAGRIINVHPSLIPAFCGPGFYGIKVHEEALKRGVKVTGATVHFVDEGCDTGPIILQEAVFVEPEDTPESLQKRVMEQAEWKILPMAIHLFANQRLQIINGMVKILN